MCRCRPQSGRRYHLSSGKEWTPAETRASNRRASRQARTDWLRRGWEQHATCVCLDIDSVQAKAVTVRRARYYDRETSVGCQRGLRLALRRVAERVKAPRGTDWEVLYHHVGKLGTERGLMHPNDASGEACTAVNGTDRSNGGPERVTADNVTAPVSRTSAKVSERMRTTVADDHVVGQGGRHTTTILTA